jgi:hypothetical protein
LVLLDEGGKAIELLGPEPLVAGEPQHGGLHRPRRETAVHGAPRLATLDQIRARQHVQVLHDGWQRDRERDSDLAYRQLRLVRQPLENRPPGRVGERREGQIELEAAKLNHVVKYRAARHECQDRTLHKVAMGIGRRNNLV